MTVKSSISLRDDQHSFATELVRVGKYPSVSAVVQQGIELLRQQNTDAEMDRAALRELLMERAKGPFISADELRRRLAARRAARPE